ncbi:MAG: hypothetical protein ACJAXV_000548 [Bacteroidia bacterium]|jgi:hypothetical protein
MKKISWIILFSISFIVCVIFYLKYDSKGYEYGFGCNFCNKKMPYNLKPHNGSEFSFSLKDEDDFELIGKGFKFFSSSFTIKTFLAYGYNDTSVLVKCTDSLNTVKYLISYETKYKNKKGNPEISFKDLSNNDFEQVKSKYKWFEVDKEKGYAVDGNKFLFMLGALFSMFFIIRQLFKLRKAKATQ